MRSIGHVPDEPSARVFGDFLLVRGIANNVEDDGSDGWVVWILDEDKLREAGELLKTFRANPADPMFRQEAKTASKIREQEQKDQEAWEKRLKERRHLFRPLREYTMGALTFGLILICVVVFVLSRFATDFDRISALFISSRVGGFLPEVRAGQLWRLVTPIFIHLDWIHIFFNMLWLRELGSMVESRQSTGLLALFVVVTAVLSNMAQYVVGGPGFGGMSGVVYGLLGYIWIRGKNDPGSGLYVSQITIIMMLAWLALGFMRVIPMANLAHLGGLMTGVIWGYVSSLRYR